MDYASGALDALLIGSASTGPDENWRFWRNLRCRQSRGSQGDADCFERGQHEPAQGLFLLNMYRIFHIGPLKYIHQLRQPFKVRLTKDTCDLCESTAADCKDPDSHLCVEWWYSSAAIVLAGILPCPHSASCSVPLYASSSCAAVLPYPLLVDSRPTPA